MIKGQTIISNKQYFKNEASKVGFAPLKIKIIEKFKVKIKLTEKSILSKMCRIVSASKCLLNFEKTVENEDFKVSFYTPADQNNKTSR